MYDYVLRTNGWTRSVIFRNIYMLTRCVRVLFSCEFSKSLIFILKVRFESYTLGGSYLIISQTVSIGQTLPLTTNRRSRMAFRLAYLHLTLTHSQNQGQGHAHFDYEHRPNDGGCETQYKCQLIDSLMWPFDWHIHFWSRSIQKGQGHSYAHLSHKRW